MGEHDTGNETLTTTSEPSQETGSESATISEPPENGTPSSVTVEMMRMTGPLPPPSVLCQYAQVDGAIELILSMAAKEQKHRHELDKGGLKLAELEFRQQADAAEGKRALAASGQKVGAMVALPLLLGGLVVVALIAIYRPDALWMGLIVGLLPVASLASLIFTFMRGERPNRKALRPAETTEDPQLSDGNASPD